MKNFLVIAFVLLVFGVSAQTIPSQNLIGVGLSSPEAASLGKFGNIPVSYSTGVPNITIPIFDINVGGLKLPISLDYHAGGVRVDEVSSSVGIGWALNAGGVLSRQMVGFPDEIQPGYLSSPALDQVYNNPTNYVSFLYANTLGQNDVNPDVFTYTIPGSSGRFIIKQDGSFLQFPTTNNRIENYTGTCYKITDQDGVGFIFEQKETTSMGMVNGVNLIPSYTSAWRLTKIVSASLADTVFINYESVANLIQNNKSYSHTIGSQPTCAGAPTPTNPNGNFYGGDTYTNQMVTVSESYPTSITWRGGQINFINVADRTDRVSGKRVSEIDVYAKNNGTLTLIKQGKLTQSYFYYLPQNYSVPQDIGNESLYRLRLDAVSFYDVNNVLPPQVYSMTYDNTPMAPRESCAQDVWGFNNGQFGNTTMMPQQTVYFDALHSGAASAYTFGSANRSTNVNYINACSIQSITYPTGGKSVFSLEPHKFNTNTTQTSPGNVECRATGSMQSSNTQTLAVTSSMTNLEYAFYFSADPNATQRPQITITDQATGQVVMTVNDMNPPTSFSSTGLFNVNGSPQLLVGHTYTILTNIYSTDPNAYAYIDVNWVNQTNIPLILQGGGLRIKTITNYDANGAQISQKSFSYGSDGTGTLLTPYNYFALNTQNTVYRIGCLVPDGLGGGQCSYSYGWPSVIYYANSVVPISQFTGSPVLYGGVTEYDAASDGSMNNGKKVYSYQISQDQQVLAYNDYTFTGVQLVSNIWRNGYLSEEQTYKSNGPSSYYLVNDKVHNYVTVRQGSIPQLRIHPKFTDDPHTCSLYSASWLNNDMWLDSYTLPYAAILLQNDTETQIDDSGNQVVRQTNYYYDDLTHVLPTRRETFDSKQEDLVDSINYPHNLAVAGNVYQTMLTRNMISPVVSYAQKKNGSQLVYGQVNYKDWNGNGSLLAPQTMTKQTLTNALETLINFDNYDKYSNILQQEKTSAPSNSYLWDYYNQYPIAKVSGANNTDIAYTSFEANGTGNWTIGSASRNTVGITGSQCYTLSNGAISKSGLTATKTYVVSYWTMNSTPYTITGTIAGYPLKGATINGWTYYEHEITGQTAVTLSGSGAIDELRLYPLGALMTTYTYNPLVGITTTMDDKSEAIYYEYDGFQRLVNIRDKNKSLVKSFCYNYAGQQTNCFVNGISYANGGNTFYYTKDCGSGATGSSVPYTVPAERYLSNLSQADANSQETADANINGPLNAMANGSCTVNTSFTLTNNTGSGYQVNFTGPFNLTYNFLNNGTTTIQVPIGTYSVSIYPTGAYVNHTISLTGQTTQTGVPRYTFSNVVVSTGTTLTALIY